MRDDTVRGDTEIADLGIFWSLCLTSPARRSCPFFLCSGRLVSDGDEGERNNDEAG